MYPPKELVVLPGCLVCIRAGVALLTAHVLQPGSYWGIADLILHNPRLWENSKTLALSYLELQFLTREVFHSVAVQYPAAYHAVRKQGILLALRNAVMRRLVDPSWGSKDMRLALRSDAKDASSTAYLRPKRITSFQKHAESGRENREVSSVVTSDQIIDGSLVARAVGSEAKLNAAMSIVKSGHVRAENKQVEKTLDELLRLLAAESDSKPSETTEKIQVPSRRFKL
jgi:hypothetical protein